MDRGSICLGMVPSILDISREGGWRTGRLKPFPKEKLNTAPLSTGLSKAKAKKLVPMLPNTIIKHIPETTKKACFRETAR